MQGSCGVCCLNVDAKEWFCKKHWHRIPGNLKRLIKYSKSRRIVEQAVKDAIDAVVARSDGKNRK